MLCKNIEKKNLKVPNALKQKFLVREKKIMFRLKKFLVREKMKSGSETAISHSHLFELIRYIYLIILNFVVAYKIVIHYFVQWSSC